MSIYSNSYRVGEYIQAPVFGNGDEWMGFKSLRRCKCGFQMLTNGLGRFRCERCGHTDKKDISRYVAAGLDYPIPPSARGNRLKLGGTV